MDKVQWCKWCRRCQVDSTHTDTETGCVVGVAIEIDKDDSAKTQNTQAQENT